MATAERPRVRWSLLAIAAVASLAVLLVAKSHAGHTRSDPFLLLAVALVGAVVVTAIWFARPAWNISAALALSMFGSHWQSLGLPHSSAPDRIVLGLSLIALLLRSPGSRDRPRIRFRGVYVVMYVAGAYAIGSAISDGSFTTHDGLFALLDKMQIFDWIVFICATVAFRTREDRRVLMWTFVGMGVYIGLTGICEILGPHAFVFPRYILDKKVGVQFGRARGPFADSVINGMALYLCLMAALMALRETQRRIPRLIAYLCIAVCGISLVLTFQRADWLGAGIAGVLTLLAVKSLRRYFVPVVLGVALLTGGIFAAFPTVRQKATTRLNDINTVQGRQGLNAASVAMIEAHPLFGVGWTKFSENLPQYLQTSNSYSNTNLNKTPVHDVYLSVGTELGLIGLTLWLCVLLWGVGGAVRRRRMPPDIHRWQILLGSLFIMWLIVATTVPLAAQFESLMIWVPAAVICGASELRE